MRIKFWNQLKSFESFLQNSATAVRTWVMPDKDGTVMMTNDVLNEPDFSSDSVTRPPSQASTKDFVETKISEAALGIVTSWKAPVKVATTADGTLASAFENGDTVDGVTLVTGDRILLKNQSSQTENGIYTVNASGAPTRATDADAGPELEGAAVMVQQGTSNENTTWIQTTDGVTIGSSNIVWSQMGTSVPDASESAKGIAEIANQSEVNTSTDDERIVTPLKLKNRDGAVATLTDASTTTITSDKWTWDTSSATRTIAYGFTGDTSEGILTPTIIAVTLTFPAGTKCVIDGLATGDNVCTLNGLAGDEYYFAIRKIGSRYVAVIKNIGQ